MIDIFNRIIALTYVCCAQIGSSKSVRPGHRHGEKPRCRYDGRIQSSGDSMHATCTAFGHSCVGSLPLYTVTVFLMETTSDDDPSDWLLTDKVSSWPGTAADRAWRYLRQALDRHDSADTGYAYSKIILETILGFDRSSPPPPWLVHVLEV